MATPLSSGKRRSLVNMESVLIKKTMQVEELKAENADLRDELETLRRHDAWRPTNRLNSHGGAIPDGVERVVSVSEYSALSAKYDELVRRNRVLETENSRMRVKYKQASASVKQWNAYIEQQKHQHRTAKMADKRRQPLPKPGALEAQKELARANSLPAVDQREDHCLQKSRAQTLPLDAQSDDAERPRSPTVRVTSSQTTEPSSDTQDMHLHAHQPSSDEEPVVVSTRPLKRKRAGSSVVEMARVVRIKQENSPERPLEIKSEEYSSPVLHRPSLVHSETSELDLDATVERVSTPRRRRGPQNGAGQRASSEEVRRSPALPARVSSLSDCGLIECRQQEVENFVGSKITPRTIEARSARGTASAADQILKALSPNVPFARRESAAKHPTRGRSDEEAAAKTALVSEDGESQRVGLRPDAHHKAAPKQIDTRLENLLNGPGPSFEPVDRDRTPRQGTVQRRRPISPFSDETPKPKAVMLRPGRSAQKQASVQYESFAKRSSPAKRTTPATSEKKLGLPAALKINTSKYARPQGLEMSPPQVRPENEPLRLRDVSALRLEDFKINPKYAGSDFAFADAARSKADRRCLQGCTDPDCCGGAFLKAVEMGATSGQSDPLVLEDYLGPDWEHMMGAYPRDKRDDLLKQARAAALANKHGKHRHAFQRHSTPPGFWRVDMPTTQEDAQDRAKASQMVRNKVEERWREAHRPGGRWKFRDE